jgi:hypothetical protein
VALLTVVETTPFIRAAERLFSDHERLALIGYLAANPLVGYEIRGNGGIRKVRFATGNRGKSGGARVIYFVYDTDTPLVLLTCYGKTSGPICQTLKSTPSQNSRRR